MTILARQKLLYDSRGVAHPDFYSSNHKSCSNFFNRFVTQENQYLLGNGVTLENDANKAKLGKDFDQRVQEAGRNALVQGVGFGFWNFDHLEAFKFTEFVPLLDEETGALMSGIRFWQIAADKPLRVTLFELDGFTEYIKRKSEDMEVLTEKRAYRQAEVSSKMDGAVVYDLGNYPGFPVVPLWGNPNHQSELVGLRENIDAYDLIKSGFINDLDDVSQVYWILKDCAGMNDIDFAQFLDRVRTTRVAGLPDGDEGASAEPHTMEIPSAAREAALERLKNDMYEDFQAFNVSTLMGGQKTATEINAAYQPMDNKVDQFEYCVLDFLQGIFAVAGIEDNPTFTRNKIANRSEEMQNLMMAAQYLDDEYLVKKVCTILGDPDAADGVLERLDKAEQDRFTTEPE